MGAEHLALKRPAALAAKAPHRLHPFSESRLQVCVAEVARRPRHSHDGSLATSATGMPQVCVAEVARLPRHSHDGSLATSATGWPRFHPSLGHGPGGGSDRGPESPAIGRAADQAIMATEISKKAAPTGTRSTHGDGSTSVCPIPPRKNPKGSRTRASTRRVNA